MDSNGLIVISLLVTVAFLVVLNWICFVFAWIQYRKRKNTINCISKDEALSSSINIQRNNFLDAREHLTWTPIQLTSGKSEFDVITNFQKLVEQEINEYFVPKIKEWYSYIQQKDWLVLSVKWNTIETLFNIDNIQDYIRYYIFLTFQ